MVSKICVFVVVCIVALIQQSEAAECVPKNVIDLKLDTDHKLTWSIRSDEECIITEYLVNIFNRINPTEYILTATEPIADVSFLEVCQQWTFVVLPISEHTIGAEQRLSTNLPIPTNANLTITAINITRTGPLNERHLQWDLADSHLGGCSLQYRLTVEVDGDPYISEIYLNEKSYNLRGLSPCADYTFGVRAINVGFPTIEGPLRQASLRISTSPQGPPTLSAVASTYNGFNSTWYVESAVRNACPIRWFYVDGTPNFSQTIVLDETDGRFPIHVAVTGLRPNTLYQLRAYIVNTAGYSQAAHVAIQTPAFAKEGEEEASA